MPGFRTHRQYWEFAGEVIQRWRHARSQTVVEFLEAIRGTCQGRELKIPKEHCFFRAQSGCEWSVGSVNDGSPDVPISFSKERMIPRRDCAREGRANSKGIPCLYVASDEKTAVSELRPWIGAYATVASLRTVRGLRLIDCRGKKKAKRVLRYARPPSQEEVNRTVWLEIDLAFAEPVDRTDDRADYAPTQVLAEMFRELGYDGIAYRSSVGGGYNVAIFDLNAAAVVERGLVRVSRLTVKFEPNQ